MFEIFFYDLVVGHLAFLLLSLNLSISERTFVHCDGTYDGGRSSAVIFDMENVRIRCLRFLMNL